MSRQDDRVARCAGEVAAGHAAHVLLKAFGVSRLSVLVGADDDLAAAKCTSRKPRSPSVPEGGSHSRVFREDIRYTGLRAERLRGAAEIARLFQVEARGGRQYCGDPEVPEIRAAIAGVHFEVKRCEALRLYAALKQPAADARQNVPLVLHRANGEPWVAIVRLEDLPRLAVQLYLTLPQQQ